VRDTPVVFLIVGLCVLAFVAELGAGTTLLEWLALWPPGLADAGVPDAMRFHPWQVVTYAFLHGSPLHLMLNLYALWLFGSPLERRWGAESFGAFYLACVVGAALVQLAVAGMALAGGGIAHPVVGASGGVFGLLLAFGMRYPDVRLMLLFPPMAVRARTFVIGYGVVELVAGVTGTAEGVAHFAHLGGMLTGYLLLRGTGTWFR
jgi:membrane associated rhomboid family serine protease